MRISALAWCLALTVVLASPAAIKPDMDKKEDVSKQELPEALTLDTFDGFTSEHLTFVEFFSPYCSHCKQLAPKWHQAFVESKEDQEKLGIHMRQVNCAESGDLCHREDISTYPNLRLYAPERNAKGEMVKGKLKFVEPYPRALSTTPENFKKFMMTSVAEYDSGAIAIPSSSQLLDIDLAMNIVAGENAEPVFVAMFSSKNNEWESGKFPSSCKDCVEHKKNWDKLSNLVLKISRTAHLNCHSHPILCEKLGHKYLNDADLLQLPRYAMFLPKAAGLIRLDYAGQATVDAMKQWVTKLAANLQYEEVTARDLEEYGMFMTELPLKPQEVYYPLTNKVSLVFAYDKNKVSKEDKAIMPHLLELVTKLPFNINLFASKSVKIDQTMDDQSKGMLEFVNSDPSFESRKYNYPMHLATTLTAKPTLYMFKENSLIPAIFQNFALEDMRNMGKIENFVRKNMYPLYQELTPELMKAYFKSGDKANKLNDKIVVTFIDTNVAKQVEGSLFNMSMTAHQYNLLKREYYFNELVNERDAKKERVAKLKAKNTDTAEVIQAMRAEIPHMFDHDDVLFTFVSLSEHPEFANAAGWNIDGKGYKAGDCIVVSKNMKLYWDLTLTGEKLTNEPGKLRPVLEYLLDPKLVSDKKITGFKLKLTGSPYNKFFRVADIVHGRGFFGYVFFVLMAYVLYSVIKMAWRKRRTSARGGIIGNGTAKSD